MKTKVTVHGKRNKKDKVAIPLKFTVVLTKDPYEEGILNATVPALPGCHSWGHTKKEAFANIKEALTGFLEVMREDGDPIPSEAGLMTVTVP